MTQTYNSHKYKEFREAVLQFGGDVINIDELYLILNRISYSDKKQYFGYSKDAKFNSRLKYHRHFIIMLEGEEILERLPNAIQAWRINRDDN